MRIFAIIAILVVTASAVPAEESFTNADLLRNFDTIAFGNEYTGQRFDLVRKWSKPMRMGIQGKKTLPMKRQVENLYCL